jgi:hypothetical protein
VCFRRFLKGYFYLINVAMPPKVLIILGEVTQQRPVC